MPAIAESRGWSAFADHDMRGAGGVPRVVCARPERMKIATWNVNSIKARIDTVLTWFKQAEPDVALLQEIKCEADAFPRLEFEALGYNCAVLGQKSYNGVAILSKNRIEDVREGLPGDDVDDHARYIEGVISTKGGAVRVGSIYLPN